MSADSGTVAPTDSDASHSSATAQRKPRFALFIATACGLRYMPVAPGTFGSVAWPYRACAIPTVVGIPIDLGDNHRCPVD